MKREITIFDIASTFLSIESMTNKKLQKLCYYSKAWYLALHNKELFENRFQAWVHGPVCNELYQEYKPYRWTNIPKSDKIPEVDSEISEFLEMVYDTYGEFDGDELESLTHSELPWKEAREDLEEWMPSNEYISEKTMKNFYREIYEQN